MRQWDILEYPSEKSSSSTSSGLSGGSLSRIIDEKLGGKAQRKKKDNQSGWRIDERAQGNIEVFLSDLPEEIDIRYRTKFIVVGSQAKLLVRRACKSTAACELRPKHEEAPAGNLTLDPGMLSQAVEKFLLNPGMDEMQLLEALSVGSDSVLDRPGGSVDADCPENCYCTVPPIYSRKASKAVSEMGGDEPHPNSSWALGRSMSRGSLSATATPNDGRELVKISFLTIVSFVQALPTCRSRAEALSTCLLFPLVVNPKLDGEEVAFEEQLSDLGRWSQEVSLRTRETPDKRPWRAVLLIASSAVEGQDSDQAEAPWKTRLSEWELQHGALSKFGPVDMEDLDAIHAAFTHISGKMLKQSIHGKTSMLKSCNWDKQNSFRAKTSVWSAGSSPEAKQRPDLARGPLSAKGFAGMYSCARKALGRG